MLLADAEGYNLLPNKPNMPIKIRYMATIVANRLGYSRINTPAIRATMDWNLECKGIAFSFRNSTVPPIMLIDLIPRVDTATLLVK